MEHTKKISFVIPVYNEAGSLLSLHKYMSRVVKSITNNYEIIFVDDGSTDDSISIINEIIGYDKKVILIALRGNFGKTAALAAGFDNCSGDIVFTMDADLQDDPEEIPNFLEKIESGFDLVSGYKRHRYDPWTKVAASRMFNLLVRTLTGIKLHDVNCGFKCYKKDVFTEINVYGEMHRFLPVLAHWKRFKICEIEVKHHPRKFGVSKFGSERIFKGLMDLLTVSFLMRYKESPSYLFGKIGLIFSSIGFLICAYLSVLWCLWYRPIGNRPLLYFGILLIIVGTQFFLNGLIAELYTHSVQKDEKPYIIKEKIVHERMDSSSIDKPTNIINR